jgi:hypothetical protein
MVDRRIERLAKLCVHYGARALLVIGYSGGWHNTFRHKILEA